MKWENVLESTRITALESNNIQDILESNDENGLESIRVLVLKNNEKMTWKVIGLLLLKLISKFGFWK